MLFVYSKSLNPYFNLALEEFLMMNSEEEVFMLWQNENTIVVGKNQNTLSEINYDFAKENNINIVRRMSGGGAVYHDRGNINFTFIKNGENLFSDYKSFTEPIISFLKSLGINATLSGRNDILIDNKKISGNAQFMKNGRVLHHGTLLLSSQADIIGKALNADPEKIASKGIKSVKSRVTNINAHLKNPILAEDFKEKLASFVIKNTKDCQEYDIEKHLLEIEKLQKEKYETWEWNFGYSPKYDFSLKKRYQAGSVEVNLKIGSDGIIEDAKIYGDFFSQNPIEDLQNALIGVKHKKEEIEKILEKNSAENYISGIKNEEFLEILF